MTVLFGFPCQNLSSSDVHFATSECRGQPFEEAAKSRMIVFHFLRLDAGDDFLTVDNSLVREDIAALSLPEHRVSEHCLRELLCLHLSDDLPAELIGAR